jgi:hypothetical protein
MGKIKKRLKITDPRVQRFPRLIEGDDASTMSKLSWQKPEVAIRITDDGHVEFKYLIPVPTKLRSISIHSNLFGTGKPYLEKSLQSAYHNEKSAGKPVHYLISNFLRRVYEQAFHNWLESAWKRANPEIIEAQLSRYDQARKRSQPDPWIAWEIVKEIDRIIPAIRKLRYELKKIPAAFRERHHILPPLSPSLLKEALVAIFPIKRHNPLSVFENAKDDKIAEEYVKCLIREKYPHIKFAEDKPTGKEDEPDDDENPTKRRKPTGKPNFKSYIRAGKEIRKVISNLPYERNLEPT